MEQSQDVKGLDRYLSAADVFALSIGVMVGWGAFVMPGTVFLPVAGPFGTLIAFVLGTIIMLVIGRNFAYLMERSPWTGGVYTYTKEAFGRDHAFLASWFLCLSYLTIVFLNGTALFIVVRTMMDGHVGGFHYTIAGNEIYLKEVLVSVFAFAVVGFLFITAKPLLQKIFAVLAFTLVAGALVISVICIPYALKGDVLISFGTADVSRGYGIFSVVILAPWAFVGFDTTAFDTAHFSFPMKKTGRILAFSIIIAGLIYAAMTLVAASFVPDGYASWGEYMADLDNLAGIISVPTFMAAQARMGNVGLAVICITALAAIFTGIIGAYRAAMRILSTMAEDHILSGVFKETKYSILFIMGISVLLSLFGRNTLNWFVDLTSFGGIVGFGYTSAAAYRGARAENDRKAAVYGLAGTVISVLFGIVQIVPRLTAMETMGSEAFLLLALWCLLGFVFYLRTVSESTLAEFAGMSVSGVVLFALLLYSSLMWIAKQIMENADAAVRQTLNRNGILLLVIIFTGLGVMMHIQDLVRKKHEIIEREKIRAVEGSLAKSQFLFNMSHDIRTPMNAIIGYTNLAKKENDPDTLHEYLSKIDTSGKNLMILLNDILEMSRIESGTLTQEYVPADLDAVFEDVRALFADQMEQKNLRFTVNTEQVQHRYVWCDRKNLNRVLMNVISNAWKFTPEGGSVSVSLRENAGIENGYGSYEVQVEDTGIGMSKDFVEKMFTAFERERTSTNSGVEGTGLGLSITKSIVDLMGGTIDVFTSPGSGTKMVIRVKFRLAEKSDLPKQEEKETETDKASFEGKRVLLVEDNLINMEIAEMILTQLGFAVETAENGEIAVEMVAASHPGHYDAILMDIQMPVMNGYEATRAIRALPDKALAGIPILAMTANAFAEDVKEAGEAGMQAHIAKPVDVNILEKELVRVLGAS